MNKEKAVTYSLLTHIRNTGSLIKGPIDIFVPLIKRTLSIMNQEGVFKGKNILEIKELADKLYSIDFPVPVLKQILFKISNDINEKDTTYFQLYNDGAFCINKYTFVEFENIINDQKKDVEKIEYLFDEFCKSSEFEIQQNDSIFRFIEQNKFNLSKYLSNTEIKNDNDYTAEAHFVKYFKAIPEIYNKIKDIYLGSIISSYIQYNPKKEKRDIELLLDTNFVTGLLDLNTAESSHTCNTLLNIAKQKSFKISILQDTIDETKNLLENKAEFFDMSFLQKKVNQEDIYNACDRRGLTKSDIERIKDNLEITISNLNINIIKKTEYLKKEVKDTDEYKKLLKIRSSHLSALHDAIAILYIKKVRGKKIKQFDDVNAWFVNNSITKSNNNENFKNNSEIFLKQKFQPELIKVDDLLNILWLSNPQINNLIQVDDLAEIGITSTISLALDNKLPKAKILRELDDNIYKYAKEQITDIDIIRIATRITCNQLQNIEKFNEIADQNKTEFVKKIEREASKQKKLEDKRIQRLNNVLKEVSNKSHELDKIKTEYIKKTKKITDDVALEKNNYDETISNLEKKLLEEKNQLRQYRREEWIALQIKSWRRKSWFELFIIIVLFSIGAFLVFYFSDWNFNLALQYVTELKSNIVISCFVSFISFLFLNITIKTIYNKYRNFSNIENFKKTLKIPDDLIELNKS